MTNPTFLTAEGCQKLEDELQYLKDVRRPEIARAIHEAKMDGDVSENAGYEEATEFAELANARFQCLHQFAARLANA